MSQHDMNIANQGFPAFRSDLNNALTALASTSNGTSAPSTTFAYQMWVDTTTATGNILYIRNSANDGNIEIARINQSTESLYFQKQHNLKMVVLDHLVFHSYLILIQVFIDKVQIEWMVSQEERLD